MAVPRGLPAGVWILGLVSLLMDASSELVYSLLPSFMATTLGASMVTIGLIEGTAEATAAITKIFSGALSDYLEKRKKLVVAGYGLAALSKPLFPLASSIGLVFTARFIDRVGKGIRGAPRDAMIADMTAAGRRGAAYGLRQSLDTVGAFVGPLLALALMIWLSGAIRSVLWIAVFPAAAAVVLLAAAVHEPLSSTGRSEARRPPLSVSDMRRLGRAFWLVVLVGGVLTLARFSEAFLLLRTQQVGLPLSEVPLTLVVMNIIYAASSYPAGRAADRLDRRGLLGAGIVALLLADVFLATAGTLWMAFIGVGLWGLHMGLTQGLLSALVADAAPGKLRGTAFGVFNLVTGGLLLAASLVAGLLWTRYGAFATFTAGAAFSVVTIVMLFAMRGLSPVRRPGAE